MSMSVGFGNVLYDYLIKFVGDFCLEIVLLFLCLCLVALLMIFVI